MSTQDEPADAPAARAAATVQDEPVVPAPPAEQPAPRGPAKRRRGYETVRDMVLSLGVVLLLIGAVALVTVRPGGGSDGVRVVSYGTELDSARVAAPFEVLAPDDLDGYRATSVRFRLGEDGSVLWHLGFVSPGDGYVGLDQTDGDGVELVDTLTKAAVPVADGADGARGEVSLGGRTWQRYEDGGAAEGDPEVRGLVHDDAGTTTLVSGTAAWTELEEFAASLSTTSSAPGAETDD